MVDKDKHNIDDGWFIVPVKQKQVTEYESDQLFENLKKITPEEIGNVWDEIYYKWMVKKLEEWYEWDPLNLDLAVYLLNQGKDKLLIDNFWKFDKAQHREIIFKFIEFLWEKDYIHSEDTANLISICEKIDKEMAILLIDNRLWNVMTHENNRWRIPAEGLDIDIVNKLKEKKYRLRSLNLADFIEKDRENVALEIIKDWWEPDLSTISTLTLRPDHDIVEINYAWTLTWDFALEIINIGTERAYKYLSDNIKYFDPSTRKSIAMRYIEDGHEDWTKIDWLYDHMVFDKETFIKLIEKKWSENWFSKTITEYLIHYYYPDKEIADKLVEKWYDFKKYNSVLFHFSDDSKCYVAVLILKYWWEPDFNEIPKEYFTQDFALEILNIKTEHAYNFLAEHIGFFDKSIQKMLALKYIEAGQWKYVDAMWPDTIRWKDIAMSLIDNGKEEELMRYMDFGFEWLDMDVVNKLIEKKYDLKKISKWLGCFREEDRKEIALEIIKAWWEPNLSLVPKRDLTQDFAQEIINLKSDNWFRVLALNIPFFGSSPVRKNIIYDLIKSGWLKYIRSEILNAKNFDDYLDKKFMKIVLESYGTTEASKYLRKFNDLDSEIALAFIQSGGISSVVTHLESFNNLNDKVAKNLIAEWYKNEVQRNKERFNLSIFTKRRLLWRDNKEEKDETLQELENFRNERKKREVEIIDEETKEEIIKAAEKVSVEVKRDSEWNKIFTMKLWNRILKILSPWLENHTDDKYRDEWMFDSEYRSEFDFNNKINKHCVELWWMLWDDISKWKNQKLKKYVKEKEKEWFHIPSEEEMKNILSELWEFAGLDLDEQQEKNQRFSEMAQLKEMLLLMYLIGMPWYYRLTMKNGESSRSMLHLSKYFWCFESIDSDRFSASLLMIE